MSGWTCAKPTPPTAGRGPGVRGSAATRSSACAIFEGEYAFATRGRRVGVGGAVGATLSGATSPGAGDAAAGAFARRFASNVQNESVPFGMPSSALACAGPTSAARSTGCCFSSAV